MNLEIIKETGELTNQLIEKYSIPYSIKERFDNRRFGMGRLNFRSSDHVIREIYLQNRSSIRTNVEPTSQGLIFRIWTPKFLKAFGLTYDEINQVRVTKEADYINPYYFSAMWFALKVGAPIRIARCLSRIGDYQCGIIIIRIETSCNFIEYEMNGFLLKKVLAFFSNEPLRSKTTIKIEK